MAAYIDIGGLQYESDDTPTPMDIGGLQKEFAAAPTGGQVIIVTSQAPVEQQLPGVLLAKLLPLFWIKQGRNKRRDFLKNTLLTILGVR